MDGELRELYQEMILEHNSNPRNFRIPEHNRMAEGYNPLCGDKVKIYLSVMNGVVKDVGFQGSGCAISTASASMLTVIVKNKTVAEAEKLFAEFRKMLTMEGPDVDIQLLGKLRVFAGVKEFPVRVKCATLAWHTLESALKKKAEVVSTE